MYAEEDLCFSVCFVWIKDSHKDFNPENITHGWRPSLIGIKFVFGSV